MITNVSILTDPAYFVPPSSHCGIHALRPLDIWEITLTTKLAKDHKGCGSAAKFPYVNFQLRKCIHLASETNNYFCFWNNLHQVRFCNNLHQVRVCNNLHQVRFCNNLHQVRSRSKYWKPKQYKGINRIAKIS
jgi:hypothetical protein